MKRKLGEFAKGSIILLAAMNIFNVLNYLFHFASARILTVENYGILAALMSLAYIFGIPGDTIQNISSRYSTRLREDSGKLKYLFLKLLKKFFLISLLCFAAFLALSPLIGKYLFINYKLVAFTGLVLFGMFLLPISRGVMQGTKKFNNLGVNYLIEGFVKLGLTLLFLYLGLEVCGAIGAVIAGALAAFFLSFASLKKILAQKEEEIKIDGIYSYSFPVLVSVTAIMLLLSMDIILTKRFFPEDIVGKYAVVSMLAKIIFFVSTPISKAMFPLASEKYDKNRGSAGILKKSFLAVLAIGLLILLVYFIIPKSTIRIMYGPRYLEMAYLLVYPSIAMLLLSMSNTLILYNLCVNRHKRNYLVLGFVVLQAVLLFLFHSSLQQFTEMLIISNTALFLALMLLNLKKPNETLYNNSRA